MTIQSRSSGPAERRHGFRTDWHNRSFRQVLPTISIAIAVLLLQGCNTVGVAKNLGNQVADEVSKGNVITAVATAAWGSTMGIAMGLIVDTVTLGGLLSSEQAGAALGTGVELAQLNAAEKKAYVASSSRNSEASLSQQVNLNSGSASRYAARETAITNTPPQISVGGNSAAGADGPGKAARQCPPEGNTVASVQASIRCQCSMYKGDVQFVPKSNGATCASNNVLIRGCSIENGKKTCGWS